MEGYFNYGKFSCNLSMMLDVKKSEFAKTYAGLPNLLDCWEKLQVELKPLRRQGKSDKKVAPRNDK